MQKKLFVDIILPLALPKLYTYSVPNELVNELKVGVRVTVQFGKKKLYSAIVHRIHSNPPEAYQTKDILQVIDAEPLVSGIQLKFWEWMASYYMCPLGDVMKAALPSGLKMESETILSVNSEVEYEKIYSDNEAEVLALFDDVHNLTVQQLAAKANVRNPLGVVKSLLEKGALTIHESMEPAFKPKLEAYVRLHSRIKTDSDVNQLFADLERAPAQQKLLMAFLSITTATKSTFTGWVPKKELLEKAQVSASSFSSLVEKNVFEVETREVSRLNEDDDNSSATVLLSEVQQEAYASTLSHFSEKNVVLLHGVTSSGKTEIYIQLITEMLAQGKQVLYLLPEIALTAQIINRLKRFFGNRVGVYHSKFSDNQRVEVYQSLLADGNDSTKPAYDIVLGVRSSVFLPFRRLGLVIVDEEHENTYKQFNPAPRYHARDAAIVLASFFNAKVLLGTATPSVESYYNAQVDKYGLVQLNQRYKDVSLPEVVVVDTLMARKRKQMKSLFSPQLIDSIGETLAKGEQVILFQNRRGYSPFVECEECAWVPQCEHCAVSLTLHKNSNQLVCHYCGYSIPTLNTCLACGSTRISTKGFGTEKVEDELSIFFPNAVIERMDMDTTRSRKSYERILSDFESGRIDILVGTQMVTKGLDFDRVSLVGILNADNLLNFPDFRAYERSFQLMSQVSGRAGRRDRQGMVIIQTSKPDHPVIQQVVKNDFLSLFREQLVERNQYRYPPYYRLVRISIKHRNENTAGVAAKQLADNLRVFFKGRVLGPEPPQIFRVQNLFIEDILLKLERNLALPKAKDVIVQEINRIKEYKPYGSLFVSVDVDPY